MRRQIGIIAAVGLSAVLLTGCGGPNEEAAVAAREYSADLTAWVGTLGDGSESLGDVLADAPNLTDFDNVEETPAYLRARTFADHVDVVVSELTNLEPDALEVLTNASLGSFIPIDELYYTTLDGATARLKAYTASLDLPDSKVPNARNSASIAFAENRIAALDNALTGIADATPDDGLGVSVGAFITDWFTEDEEFQKHSIEQLESWTAFSRGYKDFWPFGNVNDVYLAPEAYVDVLRPAYVAQVGQLAEALAANLASPAPTPVPDVPALGDPYRRALLDGYLPWDDTTADQAYALDRLWLLWRIRELEGTPEASYENARAAVLEEVNRGVEDEKAADPRAGAERLLESIEKLSDTFSDVGIDDDWRTALTEAYAYATTLRNGSNTADIDAAFDDVLTLYAELLEKIDKAEEAGESESRTLLAIYDLGEEYQQKVIDAATPALGALDDDAQFEQMLADAIHATTTAAS